MRSYQAPQQSEERFDLDLLLFRLLGKRKRRQQLLMHWHSKVVKDPLEYMHSFIDTILHQPIEFSVYSEYFSFFTNQNFCIYYHWLEPGEVQMIATAFRLRRELFTLQSVGDEGTCCLTQCRVAGNFAKHNRRELVRDYCWMGIARKDAELMFKFLLLRTLQRIKVKRKNVDPFVHQLHYALQGRKKWEELVCVME